MAESPSPEDKVQIQLGDIIEIQAPSDSSLNEKQFFVSYASPTLLKLIGEDSDQEVDLPITDTGEFRNEAITGVDLLSRAAFHIVGFGAFGMRWAVNKEYSNTAVVYCFQKISHHIVMITTKRQSPCQIWQKPSNAKFGHL